MNLEKLFIRVSFIEILSLFFFINGIKRLYWGFQGEKFNAIMNDDLEKYYTLTSLYASQFLIRPAYWSFGAFIFGVVIVGIINWKNKIYFLNSILIFIIVFTLFPIGVFTKGLINKYLDYFCGIFSQNYSISYLIGGSILTIIGIIILWTTVHTYRNTKHNTV